MAHSPLWLFLCPSCDTGQRMSAATAAVDCPKCRYRVRYPGVHRFGAEEWDADETATTLATCLDLLNIELTLRKRRLLYTTVARSDFGLATNQTLTVAVDIAEEWADTGSPRFGVDDLCQHLRRHTPIRGHSGWDWRAIALECLDSHPSQHVHNFSNPTRRLLADAYRELFANPFVPLEWNPEWFTSTVRDLAAHIYEQRKFDLMPILGDALMDAGCDHPLVQEHCRTTKPHARGCWVVDAILGKT